MKMVKYVLMLAVVAFLAYNSVYFQRLDEVKAGKTAFNAKQFAAKFWNEKLIAALGSAVEINQLSDMIGRNKKNAFAQHGHSLGIGNIRYFLVKGNGTVTEVNENDVTIKSGERSFKIATEYIFGNAVRDASGLVDINAFDNSMDFNNVSAEINQLIREKVVKPFRIAVEKGDTVDFAGAIELNQVHTDLTKIEIIPVRLAGQP